MPSQVNIASLATVRDQVLMNSDLKRLDRRKMASSVNCFARFAGRPPESIPARLDVVRDLFAKLSPARFGRSHTYWASLKCQVMKAMRLYGITILSGRCRTELPPAWQGLIANLSNTQRRPLLPFVRFCIERDLCPEHVNQSTFEDFSTTLENYSSRENRRKKLLSVCRTWNECSCQIIAWPKLQVAVRYRHDRYLDKSSLPPSFHEDVKGMLADRQRVNLLAEKPQKKLRATTAAKREYTVYRIASACLKNGIPPERLTSLAALVEPEVLLKGLEFILARAGNEPTADVYKVAETMHAIARDHARIGKSKLKKLGLVLKNLRIKQSGMTDKNRDTLRCFEDEQLVATFLGLPNRLLCRHRRLRAKRRLDAVRLQEALAVELLTVAPIRISNLASMTLDRHLIPVGHGPNRRLHLVFSAEEVKNNNSLEFPLLNSTVQLLETCLREARPVLIGQHPENQHLFPGKDGGHIQPAHMSSQLARLIHREAGVSLTAHQFRHLAGYLFLKQNPGCYETVRLLLGHQSILTTMKFYACMEQDQAVRIYDDFIQKRREELLGTHQAVSSAWRESVPRELSRFTNGRRRHATAGTQD